MGEGERVNLGAVDLRTVFTPERIDQTCTYCDTVFHRKDLYLQHLRRANKTGFCLGMKPPSGGVHGIGGGSA